MNQMPDQTPLTKADLDHAVEQIMREMSARFEEVTFRLDSHSESLKLIAATLETLDTRTAMHTRILMQRGEEHAKDRTGVSRLRADVDSLNARVTDIEKRLNESA